MLIKFRNFQSRNPKRCVGMCDVYVHMCVSYFLEKTCIFTVLCIYLNITHFKKKKL